MTCFRMDSPQKNSGGALRLQGVVPVSGWLNPAEKTAGAELRYGFGNV